VTDQQHSIVLAELDDIPEGGGIEWRNEDDPLDSVVLFKRQGQVYAYLNSCPHQGRPLGLGRPGGTMPRRFIFDPEQRLMCPHHGAIFEVEDGQCVSGPCRGAALTPVAIEVAGRRVYRRGDASAEPSDSMSA